MKILNYTLVILALAVIGFSTVSSAVKPKQIDVVQNDYIATVYPGSGTVKLYKVVDNMYGQNVCYISIFDVNNGNIKVLAHELSCVK